MSNKKYPDTNSLSRFWENVKNFVTRGALRIFPSSSEGASIDVYGDSTYNSTIGVVNSNVSGTMHLNMDTLGTKELVVYDSNGNRSTIVGQDASGNYFGDVFDAIPSDADEISYDNTTSGLTATDVQSAIDEVNSNIGSLSLAGLTDTNISSPTDGQILKYDSTSSKWINEEEAGENYVVITYTTSKNSYDSGVIASDFTKTSIVDKDGNAVSDGDVFDLIFSDGYGARLALVYSNTTYTIEMSHKVYAVPSGYSLSFPLFDVEISFNPAIIRTEVDVTFTGAVFSLIYEEYDYAPLHSPAFTGSPTAPTASVGHSGTRIATTAFVNNEIDNDTKYHKNDSFSVAGTTCLFLQTGTSARITVPLCKPVGSDVTAAVNSGNWEIRDCNGSTTNGDKTTSGHPLSYYVTTPSSDVKVNIGTNTINIQLTNLKTSTWGSTSRYTVGSAYANAGNSITFS